MIDLHHVTTFNFEFEHVDTRNLFCYLDTINRLRGQAAGSWNVQLTLESLLIDWANGLSGVAGRLSMQAARLPLTTTVNT